MNNITVNILEIVLANTYMLALKTQNFHWNYEGAHFPSYHSFFEEQYDELQEAVDVLAERIRQLGAKAPASFKEFLQLAKLGESTKDADAKGMLSELLKDHEMMSQHLGSVIEDEDMDEATKDILIARIQAHDKHAWMLRSTQ